MYDRSLYRQDGYQKGFDDGRRTGGKVKKTYIDNFFKIETQCLSSSDSKEFVKGWQEGFTEAVRGVISNMVKKEDFKMIHINEIYELE
jgi:hypothetical protein